MPFPESDRPSVGVDLRSFHLVAWLVVERGDGKVLCARRSNVGYGAGLWGLPGGHVEDDEHLAQAAAREAFEEVGIEVDPSSLVPLGVTRYVDGDFRGADFFFAARSWTGEPRALSQCSEVGWFLPDALPGDALPWLARALCVHLLDGTWLDEKA
jgi:8-oxo-dGTP diphosphatase